MFNSKDDDFQPLIENEGGNEFEGKFLKVVEMEGNLPLIVLILNFCCCPLGTAVMSFKDKNGCNKPLAMYALAPFALYILYGIVASALATSSMLSMVTLIIQIIMFVAWCFHLFLAWNNYKFNQSKKA